MAVTISVSLIPLLFAESAGLSIHTLVCNSNKNFPKFQKVHFARLTGSWKCTQRALRFFPVTEHVTAPAVGYQQLLTLPRSFCVNSLMH